eukprot:COSAG05_NODE_11956_length_489_cov_0.779487_1_plen_73_part_01
MNTAVCEYRSVFDLFLVPAADACECLLALTAAGVERPCGRGGLREAVPPLPPAAAHAHAASPDPAAENGWRAA